jgi:serine/threonine protein kinase
MLDVKQDISFARKLIHLFRPGQEENIKNEVRAISSLCMAESHENIVQVLRHGSFVPYYYIDMELCEGGNLHSRILSQPLPERYLLFLNPRCG